VPKDVTTIIWNNFLDGGFDPEADVYKYAYQTRNIGTEYYDPEESFVYPDGNNGFDGMIIVTGKSNSVSLNGNCIFAECGASLTGVSVFAKENSLTGLEFAYGIPGTCGGAVFMNAGAYGGEMSQIVKSVCCYSIADNKEIVVSNSECGFGYRNSIFSQNNNLIVLSSEFCLGKGNKQDISMLMSKNMQSRKDKQPLEYPSAGSTFKRPPNSFAGKLIEECGLKGYSCGGAQVSEKHAGFVINRDHATASDIMRVIEYVQATVQKNTGILLECEIKIIN
jgi:UDP-N-acetylmuramate dehydrogenase